MGASLEINRLTGRPTDKIMIVTSERITKIIGALEGVGYNLRENTECELEGKEFTFCRDGGITMLYGLEIQRRTIYSIYYKESAIKRCFDMYFYRSCL